MFMANESKNFGYNQQNRIEKMSFRLRENMRKEKVSFASVIAPGVEKTFNKNHKVSFFPRNDPFATQQDWKSSLHSFGDSREVKECVVD